MAQEPFGKLDHIGIAVRRVDEARKFFEGILGARFLYEGSNPQAGYRLCELDLNGLTLELLEPMGEHSFLHRFLERRGEGIHHLTFKTSDPRRQAADLKARGVRVVDETEWSETSYEAFISPRSSHGVLIQFGSGYPTLANAEEWLNRKK